jgi:hypothetical protein
VRGLPQVAYEASPALACIIGARRAFTVEMISSEERQRDPLAQQLHSVGAPELVRRQAAAHPGVNRGAVQLKAGRSFRA